MTKIFFNKTFYVQLLSTFSMGILGIPFFLIICYSLLLLLSSLIEVISIYLISLMFLALLIIIAPIFIVFILFKSTRYLFDNWVAYLIRYCLEPVLIIGGMIILVELYEVFLDQVLNHSVCWKCAWPIKIPIIPLQIPGLPHFDSTITLFCINWFMPWGYEYADPAFSISFYDIISLLILSQCMTHYISFMSQALGILFAGRGGTPGPSATGIAGNMSKAMSSSMSNIAKKFSSGNQNRNRPNFDNNSVNKDIMDNTPQTQEDNKKAFNELPGFDDEIIKDNKLKSDARENRKAFKELPFSKDIK